MFFLGIDRSDHSDHNKENKIYPALNFAAASLLGGLRLWQFWQCSLALPLLLILLN
jgi:hypothetical protein